MTYAADIVQFEEHLHNALLDGAHLMEIPLQIHVSPDLVPMVKKAVEAFSRGKGADGEAVRLSIQNTLNQYEEVLRKYVESRMADQGIDFKSEALTLVERQAIESFLMWALLHWFEKVRDGSRHEQLEKARKAMYPDGETDAPDPG